MVFPVYWRGESKTNFMRGHVNLFHQHNPDIFLNIISAQSRPVKTMFGKKEEMTEDTFIKTTKSVKTMPKEQVKAKFEELVRMCICGKCPTYNSCAKDAGEDFYCLHGTSFHCITAIDGCLCPGCPVTPLLGLKHQAYCLMGSEKSQRFDAMIS